MRLFITGTDTEVGKSVVTACLAQAARRWGSVIAAKPVASDVPPGECGVDAQLLGVAAGHEPLVFATFEAPLSPHRAAALEGRSLSREALLTWVRELHAPTTLVEGVGGWAVPLCLTPPVWVHDLAEASGGRVLVVAADRIGVLNHALLTVGAIQRHGLQVAGVVLNQGARETDLSSQTNLTDLRQLLEVPVLGVPRISPSDALDRERIGAHLWDGLGSS